MLFISFFTMDNGSDANFCSLFSVVSARCVRSWSDSALFVSMPARCWSCTMAMTSVVVSGLVLNPRREASICSAVTNLGNPAATLTSTRTEDYLTWTMSTNLVSTPCARSILIKRKYFQDRNLRPRQSLITSSALRHHRSIIMTCKTKGVGCMSTSAWSILQSPLIKTWRTTKWCTMARTTAIYSGWLTWSPYSWKFTTHSLMIRMLAPSRDLRVSSRCLLIPLPSCYDVSRSRDYIVSQWDNKSKRWWLISV